jgi:hypothetical protein
MKVLISVLTILMVGCSPRGEYETSNTEDWYLKTCVSGVGYYVSNNRNMFSVAMKPDSTVYVCNSKGEWK